MRASVSLLSRVCAVTDRFGLFLLSVRSVKKGNKPKDQKNENVHVIRSISLSIIIDKGEEYEQQSVVER